MKRSLELLKSVLVTGLLIVLPAWLALLLLIKLLVKLGVLVRPISKQVEMLLEMGCRLQRATQGTRH